MSRDNIFDGDIPVCDSACEEKRSCLDAVREDGVVAALESLNALDFEVVTADPLNPGPHFDEHLAEVDDFRFAGRTFDAGDARREDGRHDHICGTGNGGAVPATHVEIVPVEVLRIDFNVTVFVADPATESLQSFQVKINGAWANDAASRQRDFGEPETPCERSQKTDRSSHLADQVIRRTGAYFSRLNFPCVWVDLFYVSSQVAHNARHEMDVGEVRYIFNAAFFTGEERRGKDRKCGIFGATGDDRSIEGSPSGYPKNVHVSFGPRPAGRCCGVCSEIRLGVGGIGWSDYWSRFSGFVDSAPGDLSPLPCGLAVVRGYYRFGDSGFGFGSDCGFCLGSFSLRISAPVRRFGLGCLYFCDSPVVYCGRGSFLRDWNFAFSCQV